MEPSNEVTREIAALETQLKEASVPLDSDIALVVGEIANALRALSGQSRALGAELPSASAADEAVVRALEPDASNTRPPEASDEQPPWAGAAATSTLAHLVTEASLHEQVAVVLDDIERSGAATWTTSTSTVEVHIGFADWPQPPGLIAHSADIVVTAPPCAGVGKN